MELEFSNQLGNKNYWYQNWNKNPYISSDCLTGGGLTDQAAADGSEWCVSTRPEPDFLPEWHTPLGCSLGAHYAVTHKHRQQRPAAEGTRVGPGDRTLPGSRGKLCSYCSHCSDSSWYLSGHIDTFLVKERVKAYKIREKRGAFSRYFTV